MNPSAAPPQLSQTPALPPDSICGYAVLRALGPRTYLAVAEGGRHVVLKPLDPDCLLHGQLHPSIRERLARIRELALKSVANLHGVERDEHGVFLVWEFIDGQPIHEYIRNSLATQFTALMRELVLAVEALHMLGIIHGAVHARNVIIDPAGRPRLTHVSPLLYHDPAVDAAATVSMLREAIDRRGESDTPLGLLIQSQAGQPAPLRELATRIVTLVANGRESVEPPAAGDDRRRRVRTLLWALAIAVAGAGFALGIWALAKHMTPPSADLPATETRGT